MNPSVRLTRVVTFSSGHRYWLPSLSEEENRKRFGALASPFSHGHNYVLEATAEGSVDPSSGMVVNIKRIDDSLKEIVVQPLNMKSLNDEVAEFRNCAPSVENLLLTLADWLSRPGALPNQVALTHLRLYEMDTLFGDLDMKTRQITLTRKYEFCAAHRLDNPHLSVEDNLAIYGKCNNPSSHGHNYVLEVTIGGEMNPDTGMIVDLASLDTVVEDEVVERYDHKNLNTDLEEFEGRITTTEVVVSEIFKRLEGKVPGKLISIKLFETARNAFEVVASA